MNIHQQKYFSLVSLLCGLSIVPTTLTPLIVLNKISQTKVSKHSKQHVIDQLTNQSKQDQKIWENQERLASHPGLGFNPDGGLNELAALMQTLATNAVSPKPNEVDQTTLVPKQTETTEQVKFTHQDHLNQLDLVVPNKNLTTLQKPQLGQITIKQIIARIDQLIPPAVTACVISGLIAAGIGVASLVGPAGLSTVALSVGTASLEYLLFSLLLVGGKKILENLPTSLNECLKVILDSAHLESFQKLIDWLKASLNSCKDLVKFNENCAWVSVVKNAFNHFIEIFSFHHQPALKSVPAHP